MNNLSANRPLNAIEADIDLAARRLGELNAERRRAWADRREAIVAAFDAGAGRDDIAARWGLPYGTVASVLHKAGRTARGRLRAALSAAQQAHFDKLVRQGIASPTAAAIARSVAP